jgi:hypothetical protein
MLPVDQPTGDRLLLGAAQGVGLRLAPAFGDRLRQVREDHGQPEPDRDRPGEHRRVGDRGVGGQHGTDLDREHDRVVELDPRVKLLERVRQRLPQHLGVEQAAADPVRLGRGLPLRYGRHLGCGCQ